jgi:hypothetical protein
MVLGSCNDRGMLALHSVQFIDLLNPGYRCSPTDQGHGIPYS